MLVSDQFFSTGIALPSAMVFAGLPYTLVFINDNGILSLGDSFSRLEPDDFPFTSVPLIAPFWINISLTQNRVIYYRFLSNQTLIDSVNLGVDLYNRDEIGTYRSTYNLLITWDRFPLSLNGTETGVFQALITTNSSHSYIFIAYSFEAFPSGATVGINFGDGVNFIVEASTEQGNSDTVAFRTNFPEFQTAGTYVYRLDNLNSLSTPTPSVPTCSTGDLLLTDIVRNFSDFSFTARPVVCINETYGSICSVGLDPRAASVICRSYLDQLNLTSSGKNNECHCSN